MKTAKRILAIVLAMMILGTITAVGASAAGLLDAATKLSEATSYAEAFFWLTELNRLLRLDTDLKEWKSLWRLMVDPNKPPPMPVYYDRKIGVRYEANGGNQSSLDAANKLWPWGKISVTEATPPPKYVAAAGPTHSNANMTFMWWEAYCDGKLIDSSLKAGAPFSGWGEWRLVAVWAVARNLPNVLVRDTSLLTQSAVVPVSALEMFK